MDASEDTSSPEGLVNLHNNEAGRRVTYRAFFDKLLFSMLGFDYLDITPIETIFDEFVPLLLGPF